MFKVALTAALAASVGVAAQGQTVVTTFNVTSGGGGNPNVNVTVADLTANPTYVPVAVGATVDNVAGNAYGALSNGITLAGDFTGNPQAGFSFSQGAADNANPIFQNYTAVANGFAGAAVIPGTLTFSGLNDASTYDFYLLAAGDTNGQGSAITLGGTTQETAVTDSTVADATAGENFVAFTGVTSVGGEVVFTIDANTSGVAPNFLFLSGGQVVEIVPEPASFALLGLGGIAVLARRRKA